MTPTSDERREVAERLREYGNETLKDGSLLKTLKDVTGAGSWRYVLLALADLIDPTCHVVSHGTFFGSFGCEEAGTRFVLSCGHETIVDGDYPPSHCSECGARVVRNDD